MITDVLSVLTDRKPAYLLQNTQEERCRLIFALKAEIESESSALKALMTP